MHKILAASLILLLLGCEVSTKSNEQDLKKLIKSAQQNDVAWLTLTGGTCYVSQDLTIPARIHAMPGSKLRPATGVTVTVLEGFVADSLQHMFDIAEGGKFKFTPSTCQEITPQHFGANGKKDTNQTQECQAAIDAAMDAQIATHFPAAHYLVDKLRCGAPARWYGDGYHKSIVWASDQAEETLVEDTGNPVGFSISDMAFYGNPESTKVKNVIKLGFKDFPWGSSAILDNVFIYNFPNAVAFDVNQNISKIDNCFSHNCMTGIKALGNGLSIHHTQVSGSHGIPVDLESPCRIFDLEIEGVRVSPALRLGKACQANIFGLHISLSQHTNTLIEWNCHSGQLIGTRVDLGPNGSYDRFLTGATQLDSPADVFFDPVKFSGGVIK